MYGVGAIVGPLINRPYLTGEQDLDLMNQTYILDLNSTISNNNKTSFIIDESERRSKLKTPFLISGIIQLIGIMFKIILFHRQFREYY
jgi:hypothetical protein